MSTKSDKNLQKKNKKQRKVSNLSLIRISIMSIVMAAIVVSFYYQISHRFSSREEPGSSENELAICLTQDFSSNYPQNPRDVVRWYNRIITLFYSGKLSNSEIEQLCSQARNLMDKDLLAENPNDIYVSSVKQSIDNYKSRKSKIVDHDEGETSDIIYSTANDGDSLAYVTSYYFTQEASSYVSTYQRYCLRRDGSGKYKILAFELINKEDAENNLGN